jgi:hypothetical protein
MASADAALLTLGDDIEESPSALRFRGLERLGGVGGSGDDGEEGIAGAGDETGVEDAAGIEPSLGICCPSISLLVEVWILL